MKEKHRPSKSWLPWKDDVDVEVAMRPVFEQSYAAVTTALSREIHALIEDSQGQYDALLGLERSLIALQGLILKENVVEDTSREESLKSAQNIHGREHQYLAEHEESIQILSILVQVTQQAISNICKALSLLEGVEDSLKELRTRTAVPGSKLEGGADARVQLTLHQQIQLVEHGVAVLEDSRSQVSDRAKELSAPSKPVEENRWGGQFILRRGVPKRI